MHETIQRALSLAFMSLSFVLSFTISNQIAGIEEDRKNKPWRPLIRKLCSIDFAYLLLILSTAVYLIHGYVEDVFWYCVSRVSTFGPLLTCRILEMEGDKIIGRETFPMLFKDMETARKAFFAKALFSSLIYAMAMVIDSCKDFNSISSIQWACCSVLNLEFIGFVKEVSNC
nr:unnamed protein product [Naegleria fowleri]